MPSTAANCRRRLHDRGDRRDELRPPARRRLHRHRLAGDRYRPDGGHFGGNPAPAAQGRRRHLHNLVLDTAGGYASRPPSAPWPRWTRRLSPWRRTPGEEETLPRPATAGADACGRGPASISRSGPGRVRQPHPPDRPGHGRIATTPAGSTLGGAPTATASKGVGEVHRPDLDTVVGAGTRSRCRPPPLRDDPITVDVRPATQLVIPHRRRAAQSVAWAVFGMTVDAQDPFGDLDPSYSGLVGVPPADQHPWLVQHRRRRGRRGLLRPGHRHRRDLRAPGHGHRARHGHLLRLRRRCHLHHAVVAVVGGTAADDGGSRHQLRSGDQCPGPVRQRESNFNGKVTVALSNAEGYALRGGNLSISAAAGTASFSGLSIGITGTYSLTATSGNVQSPDSGSIEVLPTPAASLALTTRAHQPSGTRMDSASPSRP